MKIMIALNKTRARAVIGATLAVVSASVLFVGLGAAPAMALTTSNRCYVATMINVRGSTETAGSGFANGGRTYAKDGFGKMLLNLDSYANSDPNLPVYEEALNYPAVVFDPGNPQATTYVSSVQYGINNLVGEINDLYATCPYTNILLAGYSQGAAVIDNAIGVYHGSGLSIPALTTGALAHVTSVMLFGDPDYRPGEVWDAAGDGTGVGFTEAHAGELSNMTRLAWLAPAYTTQGYVTKVRSYCFTGDFFCQSTPTPAGLTVHGSYGASNAPLDAWTFTVQSLTDYS